MGMFLGSVLASGCGPVDGGEKGTLAPVRQAMRLSLAAPVAAGAQHALSTRSDGTVKSWGSNSQGQLGVGVNGTTLSSSSTPMTVSGLSGVRAVGAGDSHSFAIKSDGTLWAWGYNYNGQLGDGTTQGRTAPVQVSGLTNVVAVSGGNAHSLALCNDGTVWAWGNNTHGQLGAGSSSSSVPVRVTLPASAVAIATGLFHSLAVLSTGQVMAWGRNDQGQLGKDLTVTKLTVPTEVSGVAGAVDVGAGRAHSLAVLSDGSVLAWGHNVYGQLGDGTDVNRVTPVPVSALTGVSVVSGGRGQYTHTIAVSAGSVLNWGSDAAGQLGDDVSDCPHYLTAQYVKTPYAPGVSGVEYVAAGEEFSVAQLSDGSVRAWGLNTYGRLGIGTAGGCRDTPQVVVGL